MGEVVDWSGITTNDIPAEKVLEGVRQADPEDLLVIHRKDNHVVAASTTGDVPLMLWLMEIAKRQLMDDE